MTIHSALRSKQIQPPHWTGLETMEPRLYMSVVPIASDPIPLDSLTPFQVQTSILQTMMNEDGSRSVGRFNANPNNNPLASSQQRNNATLTSTDSTSSSNTAPLAVTSTSPFNIIINAGPGLIENPDAFAAIERAVIEWESFINDPITVIIDFEFAPLYPSGVVGVSTNSVSSRDYNTVRQDLINDAADEPDDAITAYLPNASEALFLVPTSITLMPQLGATVANFKALGIESGRPEDWADSTIKFNSTADFDFDNTDGVSDDQIDLQTIALHEIGHTLGFVSVVDRIDSYVYNNQTQSVNPYLMDLFRFQDDTEYDPGTPQEFTTMPRFLAPGGVAITDQIENWGLASDEIRMSTGLNLGDRFQASHLSLFQYIDKSVMTPAVSYGESQSLSHTDLRILDLIGYDIDQPDTLGMDPITITRAQYNAKKNQVKVQATNTLGNQVRLIASLDNGQQANMIYNVQKNNWYATFDTSNSPDPPTSVTVTSPTGDFATATFDAGGKTGGGGKGGGGKGNGKPSRLILDDTSGNLASSNFATTIQPLHLIAPASANSNASASSNASTWLSLDSLLNDSAKRGKGVVDIIGG